ncbi:MAG: hypothetical protein E7633_04415 [Ruminococcaceae bacterium]|nr:hypothetical protein [Oscillospiraceae bacterium]
MQKNKSCKGHIRICNNSCITFGGGACGV